jgi:predicted P-loop ATPase
MDNKTSPEQEVNGNNENEVTDCAAGTHLNGANGHAHQSDEGPDTQEEIEQLSRLSLAKYGILRKATAKRLGMTLAELDPAVKRARNKRLTEEDGFARDDNGIIKNEANVLLALDKLGVELSYNEFTGKFKIEGLTGYGPDLDDGALDELYLTVEREYGLKLTDRDFSRIIEVNGRRRGFHPVQDYLKGLKWDGVARLSTWLTVYFGAEDTTLNRAIGRLTLVAAVRRIRKPGVKFDTMLVLEGIQGAGKSHGVKTLCPNESWFTDSVTLHNTIKEVMELTAGKWIVEIGELAGMRKAAAESLKSMLSRQTDEARKPYARYREEQPRQSIFIGTTNEEHYLIDDTGNRRFLPVKTGVIDIAALKRDRDQLWAEAVEAEAENEVTYLSRSMIALAEEAQRDRELTDEWEGPISEYLTRPLQEMRVTGFEVATESALAIEKGRIDSTVQKRISRCLKRLKWKRAEKSNGKWYWRPIEVKKEVSAIDGLF